MLFAGKHDGAGICFCSLSISLQTLFADSSPAYIYLKVSPVWESVQSCWWTRWWRFSSGGPECCRCQRYPHRTGSGRRCWHPRLTDPAACSRKSGQSTREGEHWRSHSPEPATRNRFLCVKCFNNFFLSSWLFCHFDIDVCIYWAIQRSWFARVNALCNLLWKKLRDVAAHFWADFWVGVASRCV